MRKVISTLLVLALFLAFATAASYACDGAKTAQTTAQKSAAVKSTCSGSDVTAKLVSAHEKCPYSGVDCPHGATMAGIQCTPEDCAKWAKMCQKYGDNAEVRLMSVQGMTCPACEKSVSASLTKSPGVLEVAKVDYKTGLAVVIVDKNVVKNKVLTTNVASKGFQAQVIPAVAKSVDDPQMKESSTDMPKCSHPCTGAKKEAKSDKTSH